MTGIGEQVRSLGDPKPFGVVVVPSEHKLSTPEVYAEFDRLGLGRDGDELDRLSGQVPGAAYESSLLAERLLHNDLEAAARSLCPAIGDALVSVRAAGAVRAMVSGSGPTVVGLFTGDDGPAHARAAAATLAERHPGTIAAEPVGRGYAAAAARLMHPVWLAGAAALAVYLVVRRRHHGRVTLDRRRRSPRSAPG